MRSSGRQFNTCDDALWMKTWFPWVSWLICSTMHSNKIVVHGAPAVLLSFVEYTIVEYSDMFLSFLHLSLSESSFIIASMNLGHWCCLFAHLSFFLQYLNLFFPFEGPSSNSLSSLCLLGTKFAKKWFEWFGFFFLVMLRITRRHNSLLLFPYLHSCFVKVHCQAYPEKCLMSGYLNAHEDTKWKQKSCSDLLWAFVAGNYTNHVPQQDTFCFGGDWRQITVLPLAVLTSLFHRHSGVFDLVVISIPT